MICTMDLFFRVSESSREHFSQTFKIYRLKAATYRELNVDYIKCMLLWKNISYNNEDNNVQYSHLIIFIVVIHIVKFYLFQYWVFNALICCVFHIILQKIIKLLQIVWRVIIHWCHQDWSNQIFYHTSTKFYISNLCICSI